MPLQLRRTLTAAVLTSLVMPVAILVGAPVVSAATPCSVVNTSTHVTYSNLQKAIGAAHAGKTLRITGTYVGNFKVGKNLVLREGSSAGILKGNGGTTLKIAAGKAVWLYGLVITGGHAPSTCPEWTGWVCGGGIYNNGTLSLDRTSVHGNAAHGGSSGSFGGGVYNSPSGTLTLFRSTVSGNTSTTAAIAQAGGIANDGTLTLRSSTMNGNIATSTGGGAQGGAILNDSGTTSAGHQVIGILTVVNSTLSGNQANADSYASGGAIANWQDATTTITSSTIAGNVANGPVVAEGGGIGNPGNGGVTVNTSIVAGNTATSGPDCLGALTSGGHNLIGKGDGCVGPADGVNHDQVGSVASPLDPKLGLLASNGGPTRTRALLSGSPALNHAGSAPCGVAKDQRGVNRPQGAGCDIGAFEKN